MMIERRAVEWVKMAIQILIIVVGLTGAYYKLDGRVLVVEAKMQQEVIGYQALIRSISERLDKIEKKLDCVADKRFCGR